MAIGIIEMELAGKGNGWTEILDVREPPGISWHRGFSGSRVLDCVAEAGTLNFVLDNSEDNSVGTISYYSPDHANKRPGFNLNIGVRYRIGSNIRFTGVLDAIDPVPGTNGPRTVSCEAVDWMDMAQRTSIENLPIQIDKRGDEVFQTLIASLTSISRPLSVEADVSAETYPYTLDRTRDEQTKFRDELYRICLSGLDRAWVRGDGTLVYESRTRRAIVSSDVDTFTDANSFIAKRDRSGIVNKAQTRIHPRKPSAVDVVMFSLNSPTPIAPGQTIDILGPWTDPDNPDVRVGAVSLVSLVATTDYTVHANADGTGTNLTSSTTVGVGLSGNATKFSVTLSGSVAGFITKLQQRGKPLYDYGPSVLQWSDEVSIEQFGLVIQPIDMYYQDSINFGLEVAQYVVFTSSNPLTQIEGFVRFVPMVGNDAELQRSILRDISDRIKLTDPVTGISRSFFINAIDESEYDGLLKTEWLLAYADSTAFWLLEVVGRSELDLTTRLGFGLIIGHTDILHGDSHSDSAHVDTPHNDIAHIDSHTDSHTDTAHSDGGHVDTHDDVAHSDVAHSDSHSDVVHVDVSHLDSSHSDSHSDISHVDSHSDVAHTDTHTDFHADSHLDEIDPHADNHNDTHNDVAHNDIAHTDTHVDTAHTDSHNDTAHSDRAHSDTLHADTHNDAVHSDSHTDVHTDAAHSDTGHADHTDASHSDTAHSDTNHIDTAHGDNHVDTAHSDIN